MTVTDSGISAPSAAGSTAIAIACFVAVAVYNVVELNFINFATFKRRSGLYFWSFMVSTWGTGIYSTGFLLKHLQLSDNNVLYVTLIVIGWCSMVTGQSVVLYSRLHILLRNRAALRAVLGMIIVDAIICHIPIIVMVYGANSSNPVPFIVPYSIYEKVQVTIFFIQELIISGLYIWKAVKLFRLETLIHGQTGRSLLIHLSVVNVIVVILDITILALEYSNLYDIQTSYKGLVYSIKLKLEFSILNRLVELTSGRNGSSLTHSTERGIQLDRIGRDKNKSVTRDRDGKGMGYRASIHTERVKKTERERAEENTSSVFMTTEVVIQRDRCATDMSSLQETESVDATSATTANTRLDGTEDGQPPSSSSSQIQFAKTWC